MAEIGWIDFSPKDRQRVGTILELMKPSGQVDELGIGTIRDALADRLFPGISLQSKRERSTSLLSDTFFMNFFE